MSKKKTQEEYIAEVAIKNPSIEVIGKYNGNKVKIEHRCKIHNKTWEIKPINVLSGQGCDECRIDKLRDAKLMSEEQYVDILKEKVPHVNLIGKYVNMRTPTLHYCTKHNLYWKATPANLIRGCGCKYCANDLLKTERIKTNEEYSEDLYELNPNIVAIGKYEGANVAILHKCLLDGNEWFARPGNVLFGTGCPKCNESHGEKQIGKWLEQNNITYEPQYVFEDCKDKKLLPFDFYLPDFNALIEYDGEQHFRPVNFGGSSDDVAMKRFEITQYHDFIKTKYCQDNNIQFLRIPYFKNIEEELNNFIHLI